MQSPEDTNENDSSLTNMVTIDDIGRAGFILTDGGRSWTEPWSNVDSVVASRVPDGDHCIVILALGVGERTLLVAESDEIWQWLTAVLHLALDIEPYERWGPALMADPAPTRLYPR